MPEGNGQKPNPPDPQRPSGPNMRMPSRGVVSWMMFLAMALLVVVMLNQGMSQPDTISISEFEVLLKNQEIETLTIKGEKVLGVRKANERTPKGEFEVLYGPVENETQQKWVQLMGGKEVRRVEPSYWVQILITMLPWLFIFLFIWFVVFRQIRAAGGGGGMLGNFGRSRHRVTSKEHVNVTFADVAGIEEAKDEVQELIEFLKNPKRFQRLGGRIPRGVLLVGQPGCGKTLLAKAIAGEADVPFFSISGSDFVEMFVGVGASRVATCSSRPRTTRRASSSWTRSTRSAGGGGQLWWWRPRRARADAQRHPGRNGRVRDQRSGHRDRRDQPGGRARSGADPPRQIRPAGVRVAARRAGRYEILKVHARKISMGPNVDLRRLARATPMFSGAELAAIINESAIIATLSNKDYVEMEDLEEARDKVRWGRAKRSRQVDEHDQKVTAYHEAGHAIVQAMLKDADPLHKVSILPRGQMGGATFSLPERDRMVYTKDYLTATIMVTFGGRIAEDMFFKEISSGAGMDIRQATGIARKMVMEFGMNEELGFIYYGDGESGSPFEGLGQREYSESTAQRIDTEIKKLIDKLYAETEKLMASNREKIVEIAEALLKYETLTGDEVHTLIRGESLDKPSISDLLDADDASGGKMVGKARPVPKPRDTGLELGGGELGGGELPAPG
jgi:cell division protease FtsH